MDAILRQLESSLDPQKDFFLYSMSNMFKRLITEGLVSFNESIEPQLRKELVESEVFCVETTPVVLNVTDEYIMSIVKNLTNEFNSNIESFKDRAKELENKYKFQLSDATRNLEILYEQLTSTLNKFLNAEIETDYKTLRRTNAFNKLASEYLNNLFLGIIQPIISLKKLKISFFNDSTFSDLKTKIWGDLKSDDVDLEQFVVGLMEHVQNPVYKNFEEFIEQYAENENFNVEKLKKILYSTYKLLPFRDEIGYDELLHIFSHIAKNVSAIENSFEGTEEELKNLKKMYEECLYTKKNLELQFNTIEEKNRINESLVETLRSKIQTYNTQLEDYKIQIEQKDINLKNLDNFSLKQEKELQREITHLKRSIKEQQKLQVDRENLEREIQANNLLIRNLQSKCLEAEKKNTEINNLKQELSQTKNTIEEMTKSLLAEKNKDTLRKQLYDSVELFRNLFEVVLNARDINDVSAYLKEIMQPDSYQQYIRVRDNKTNDRVKIDVLFKDGYYITTSGSTRSTQPELKLLAPENENLPAF